jgi:malonate transporter
MSQILGLVLPFFGLIGLGYASGRLRYVAPAGAAGLEFLVLYLALPVFFFLAIVEAPAPPDGAVSFVLTTTFATYCAFAIAFSVGALVNGGNVPDATVQGLVGSYSNTAYLAPALVIAAFGPAAAVPAALIFALDHALLFVATPLMMALGGTVRSDPLRIAQEMARHVLLHPVVLATALGLVFLAFGIRLPEAVETALSVLGAAAPAAALFALGLALSFRSLGRPSLEMPAVVLAKLVVHPFIAYLLLSWVGGFDRIWVSTGVLLAALPPALDVLSMAQRYRVPADRAATAIGVAMIASVVTVTIALILLVNGLLPSDPFR